MPGGIHPPPSVLLSWPTPNYADPERRGWLVPILCVVLCSVALFLTLLRLYARFVLLRSAGIDDYFIALANLPLLGLSVTLALGDKVYHFDRHAWDIPVDELAATRKVLLAVEILYIVATGLTKLSVLLFYRRLSDGGVSVALKRIAQAAIIFVAISTVFFFIYPFLSCKPFAAFFDQVDLRYYATQVGKWKCLDELAHLYVNGAISIFQDFIAVGLPLALFWNLQLPRREKVLLGGVFLLGFCVCAAGILRLLAISFVYTRTYDVTWHSQNVWIWTGVEANVAVICACLPCCRIYLRDYISPSLFSRSTGRHASSGGGGRTVAASFVKMDVSSASGSTAKTGGIRKVSVVQQTDPHAMSWYEDEARGCSGIGVGGKDELGRMGSYTGPGARGDDDDVVLTLSRSSDARSPSTATASLLTRSPSRAHLVNSIEMHDWQQRGGSPV